LISSWKADRMADGDDAKRRAKGEQTELKFRAAAREVFSRDGYLKARIEDIAAAAGRSPASFYNYFDSKEAVLLALTDHHKSRFHGYVEQPFDSDDPLLQLRQLIGRANDFVEQNGALFNLYIQAKANGHDSLNGTSSCVVQDSDHERYTGLIRDSLNRGVQASKIRDDIPVVDLVWALHSMMEALLLDWCRHPNSFSLKQRGDEIVTLFLEGAGTR